jgi:site-specific recombinase XerD
VKTASSEFADLVMAFFVQHLAKELNASPNTITSYRDTFRLLLQYLSECTGRPVVRISIGDLEPDTILSFLDYLEQQRGNTVSTRNARLAAIRSFFAYSATRDAGLMPQAQRVLAIPSKKAPSRLLGYLTESELRMLLSQPERGTHRGRRDYLVLALLYDTGARVQELVDLRPMDFRLDRLALATITGKGRKKRIVPLMPAMAKLVREHLVETNRSHDDSSPLLRNYRGEPMTRSGVAFLLDKYRQLAAQKAPSLGRKSISPHTMRHTKAMHMFQAGISAVDDQGLSRPRRPQHAGRLCASGSGDEARSHREHSVPGRSRPPPTAPRTWPSRLAGGPVIINVCRRPTD